MATDPVTRQLAFNAMSPQLEAMDCDLSRLMVMWHCTSFTSLFALSGCIRSISHWTIMSGWRLSRRTGVLICAQRCSRRLANPIYRR
eukprot:3368878-Pleurochrysis_carterae.AAC.1